MIRPLRKLYADGGRKREFTISYAGDWIPPDRPHMANWTEAERHWAIFNGKVMKTSAIPEHASGAEADKIAEEISIGLLWPLSKLGTCPTCPAADWSETPIVAAG